VEKKMDRETGVDGEAQKKVYVMAQEEIQTRLGKLGWWRRIGKEIRFVSRKVPSRRWMGYLQWGKMYRFLLLLFPFGHTAGWFVQELIGGCWH
jgi:hypothetical protein